MTWTKVEITLPPDVRADDERLEVLSAALFEIGAGGIETKDEKAPIILIASFDDKSAGPDLSARLDEALDAAGIARALIALSPYETVDWSTHWRAHFDSKSFGSGEKTLWIVPTWLEPPKGAAHVLRIDPSSAFGTGLHATTAMCLEKIVELSPIESLLDVGTGTGILALAALELGAKRAAATDNDPEALRVARENAELNGKGALRVSDDEPHRLGERYQVVVANILALPLIHLAPFVAAACADGGMLILSGITASQADDVISAYAAEGFDKRAVLHREEWARIDLVKTRPGSSP